MNNKPINYFKIGSFVITGIMLILMIVIFTGSKALFQKKIYVETYFNESVQGLSVGSQVKYLGINVGTVKEISVTSNIYDPKTDSAKNPATRYVYVLMTIKPKLLEIKDYKKLKQIINTWVNEGLRVQLKLQNVTGGIYLELNFADPDKNPALPIYWTPKNIYIPSTPSTLKYISNEALRIVDELKTINFQKLFDSMQQLATSAGDVTIKLNNLLANTDRQLIASVNNIHTTSTNLNALLEQTKDFPSYTLFGKLPPRLDPGKL